MEEYFSEAHRFLPERWMKTEAASEACPFSNQKIHPFVSLPFGYGRRTCLGRRFAEAEMAIILSKVAFSINLLLCFLNHSHFL